VFSPVAHHLVKIKLLLLGVPVLYLAMWICGAIPTGGRVEKEKVRKKVVGSTQIFQYGDLLTNQSGKRSPLEKGENKKHMKQNIKSRARSSRRAASISGVYFSDFGRLLFLFIFEDTNN
jgi:hypothetical protein